MTTLLAILGLVALFVLFGLFRPGLRRGCAGDCGHSDGSCHHHEPEDAAGDERS
jgi:hypothetical protein